MALKILKINTNLSVVTAKRLRIEATPERTLEYSAILQAPLLTNSRAKYCTISMGPAIKTRSKSAICKNRHDLHYKSEHKKVHADMLKIKGSLIGFTAKTLLFNGIFRGL